MSERTLAIIKPDAVKKNAIGDIINRYEKVISRACSFVVLFSQVFTA